MSTSVARLAAAVSVLLVSILSACGGGSDDPGPSPPTPPPPPAAVTVSGVAGKGLLLNAVVTFRGVTNGTVSTSSLASTRTDAGTGAFSASVASADPVVVEVTTDANTKMLDELSGSAIAAPAGLKLRAVLPSLTNLKPIAVTPLTEMAVSLASAASGGLTVANINAATTAVDNAFLAGAASLNTQPIDVTQYKTAPVVQQRLSKLLVALAVAASQGTATNASGAACDYSVGDYGQRLVCLVGGLGGLLKLGAGNAGTLQGPANYLVAAYAQINQGNVTVGGQAPSALGLDTVPPEETAFVNAVAAQTTQVGFDPGASPVANTKALFADVRTNIVDQGSTQTFGLAPVATAMADDFRINVRPVLHNGGMALGAMKIASDLLAASHSDPSAGEPTDLVGPNGIVLAPNGNLYVASGSAHVILQVTPSGTITSFAGLAGVAGSADGTGSAARFSGVRGLAVDAAGNLYVADQLNHTIRKISPAGVVSTIAGQVGTPGNADGTGAAARFSGPGSLAIDTAGNLYVSEAGNRTTVRKITPAGVVTTFAQNVAVSVGGVAVDAAGNVYATDLAAPRVRKITPAGAVSTLAGASVPASADGTGLLAGFRFPLGVAVDGAGNVYVADTGNNKIRKITPAGVVTTIAGNSEVAGNADGAGAAAQFSGPIAIAPDGAGNLYVTDFGGNSVRKIAANGAVSTVAHGAAVYRLLGGTVCGYDPPRLSPGQKNVAVCRYGGLSDPILLTLTETGAGAYHVTTQPLTGTFNPIPPVGTTIVLNNYTLSTTIPALDAAFTIASGTGNAITATASGPLYVTAAGGQVTTAVSVAAADGWDLNTGTGTLALSGTFSGGSGGVSLANATLGPDSKLVLTNLGAFEGVALPAGSAVPSAHGSLAITDATTSAFSYGAKFDVGAPVTDKSGTVGIPRTVTLSGSVAQVGAGGTKTPLFTGTIGLSVEGIPSFDINQPISSSNFVTTQLQIDGKLSLTGGRLLSLTASLNGSQEIPTPDHPFSLSVTYSYVTPKGTALLNTTAKYDTTNGLAATIKNNGGVTVNLAQPANTGTSALTGSVTAGGQATATISGTTIHYSDGTTESLF